MSGRRPEQGWFEKAEAHLEMARRALGPGNPLPAMACYHAQQCAEKHLKGFLISQSMQFNFVHDLLYLTQECAKRKPAFLEFMPTAEILGRYGAGVRYPMERFVEPDDNEALEAVRLAESVAAYVKQSL